MTMPATTPNLLDRLTAAEDTLQHAPSYVLEEARRAIHDANTVITLIFATLDGQEWDSDTSQIIADHLADYGLVVRGCDED
jgi:hypothetical protein